ncbi:MAG: hypothetical protein HYV40_03330 [Candidatus Levybacteria bacterium]|nr:hypothetical protein [Candidatus Levybacteria bacterium]
MQVKQENPLPDPTIAAADRGGISPLSPDKLKIVDASFTVSSIDQALQYGMTPEDVLRVCQGVSQMIDDYNSDHPSEMLSKSPETLLKQLGQGLSCLIVSKMDEEYFPLYHGSIYPVFEEGEEQILGTQLVEFGSAITHPEFRRGYRLGSRGAQNRLRMIQSLGSEDVAVAGITTVKRLLTGHLWGNLDVRPVSFWEYPYTAYLTNTCEKASERFGHESCGYRRGVDESTPDDLSALFIDPKDNPTIPCTLLATDPQILRGLETRCQDLHAELGGVPLFEGDISVNDYQRAAWFFDQVTMLAKRN